MCEIVDPYTSRSERCREKLHLQYYLEMLWSKMVYFGLLGDNHIF